MIQGEIPSGKKLHQIKGRREEGGVRERGKRLGVGDVGIKRTNGKQTFFFTALNKRLIFWGFWRIVEGKKWGRAGGRKDGDLKDI